MKHLGKSILARALCFVVVLSGCSGTVSSETAQSMSVSQSTENVVAPGNYDEHFDIDLMSYFVMDVSPDDEIIQYLNDKFNVTINPTITNWDNYASTLQMKISAGETPDWFRVNLDSMVPQLVDDGVVINVSDYAKNYGFKNIQATLESPLANLLERDGSFYCVPDSTGYLTFGIYVRKDWMDELGLEVPTTWEAYKDVLKAFADADLDGKGATPLTTYGDGITSGVLNFYSCWTGYNTWGYLNDELQYFATDPAYKECIKYWADLYANGLIDPELFSNSYEDCMTKFDTGRAGMLMMNQVQIWWDANESAMKEYDPSSEMMSFVPIPAGPAGAHVNHGIPYAASSYFSSEMSEAKRIRVLEIMDYLLSDEGRELTLYGIEGKHHTVVDGQKVQNADVVNKEWGQSIHLMGELADFGASQDLTTSEWVQSYVDWLDTPGNAEYNYAQYFSTDETVKLSTNILEVYQSYFVSFITGEKDVDTEWNAYVEAMNNAGVPELTKLTDEFIKANGYDADMVHVTR